jgi:hypothetical protein
MRRIRNDRFRCPEVSDPDAGGKGENVTSRAIFEVGELDELFLRV